MQLFKSSLNSMFLALAAIYLLIYPLPAVPNGNNGGNGCPEEGLVAETSFHVDDEGYPFIYGRAWVSNLTYYPWDLLGAPCISSDHQVDAYHYYEDLVFDVFYNFRLWVDGFEHQFQSNPRYYEKLDRFNPEEQAMPEDHLSYKKTLWVDVSTLPADREGRWYTMSAYTRIDAYYKIKAVEKKFSWKDCVDKIQFQHFPQ